MPGFASASKLRGLVFIPILLTLFLAYIGREFLGLSDKARVERVEENRHAGQLDSTVVKSLQASLLLQFQSEGLEISKSFVVKDSYGMPISLLQLVGKKPKVVFYYSELNCQVCVDHEIENIKRFGQEVGKENILIVSSYRHHKNLSIFRRVHELDMEVYNRGTMEIGLPSEATNRPCLFLTDSSLVIKSVFIPVKEIDNLSGAFYSFAKMAIHRYSKS